MTDVNALAILSAQIENFRKISEPPSTLDGVDKYCDSIKQVSDNSHDVVEKVKEYITKIEHKIKELRNAQMAIIQRNQDAIQKILEKLQLTPLSINDGFYTNEVPTIALAQLELAHRLEKNSRDIMQDRLNELLNETERVITKTKDGAGLFMDDIDGLMGCLKSWKDVKKESFEEEKRKQLEEERRKQEAEKRRREGLDKKKKDEEERKKREEEERRKREREEAERKAEEERTRKEEEERLQKEEEMRKKQEEEERIKREAEERQRKIEEERKRREEEAARKREEERRRLEAERKEKERLQKEAEERAYRQDPNNWSPIRYERECDEVDGKRAYHGGINCVMISPPGGIEKDDIECNYSDEVDSIIEILENDEKPISSLIDVRSTKGMLHSEVPSMIYIPHYPVFSAGDETIVKITIDGNEWVTLSPEQTTSNLSAEEKLAKRMAGVVINDFSSLKVIVVTRPRYQTIIVDRPGVTATSTMDKNVKLFVPREAFLSKTELKLVVQNISDEALQRLLKEDSSIENILSVNTMITLTCAKRPGKAIEIDLLKNQKQGSGKSQRGKSYQLYTSKDKVWKFADVEFKGNHDDLSISLPSGRDRYTIMELEMPSSFPKENVLSIAEAIYTAVNTTFVKMIVRQHQRDLHKCVIRIVRREQLNDTLEYLAENGFTEGPGESGEFPLKEGQQVEIYCTGNIENSSDDSNKAVRPRTAIGTARVKFPYYLTSLAVYLSRALCEDNRHDWQEVLKSLIGKSDFSSGYRIAKRKHVETDDDLVCRVMLLDWMKAKAVHDDKLFPIMIALKRNGHVDIAESCEEFVKFQKENLSDAVISDIATNITKDVQNIGQALGIPSTKIEKYVRDHPDNVTKQHIAVLSEWRESEDVLRHGEKAVNYLKSVCF